MAKSLTRIGRDKSHMNACENMMMKLMKTDHKVS